MLLPNRRRMKEIITSVSISKETKANKTEIMMIITQLHIACCVQSGWKLGPNLTNEPIILSPILLIAAWTKVFI